MMINKIVLLTVLLLNNRMVLGTGAEHSAAPAFSLGDTKAIHNTQKGMNEGPGPSTADGVRHMQERLKIGGSIVTKPTINQHRSPSTVRSTTGRRTNSNTMKDTAEHSLSPAAFIRVHGSASKRGQTPTRREHNANTLRNDTNDEVGSPNGVSRSLVAPSLSSVGSDDNSMSPDAIRRCAAKRQYQQSPLAGRLRKIRETEDEHALRNGTNEEVASPNGVGRSLVAPSLSRVGSDDHSMSPDAIRRCATKRQYQQSPMARRLRTIRESEDEHSLSPDAMRKVAAMRAVGNPSPVVTPRAPRVETAVSGSPTRGINENADFFMQGTIRAIHSPTGPSNRSPFVEIQNSPNPGYFINADHSVSGDNAAMATEPDRRREDVTVTPSKRSRHDVDFSNQQRHELNERAALQRNNQIKINNSNWLNNQKTGETNNQINPETNNQHNNSGDDNVGDADDVMNRAFIQTNNADVSHEESTSDVSTAPAIDVSGSDSSAASGRRPENESRWQQLNAIMMMKLKQTSNFSKRQLENVLNVTTSLLRSVVNDAYDLDDVAAEVDALPKSVWKLSETMKMTDEHDEMPPADQEIGKHEKISVHAICDQCEKRYAPKKYPKSKKCKCGAIIIDKNGKPKYPLTTMSLIKRLEDILKIPGVEEAMRQQARAVRQQLEEDPTTMYDIMGAKIAQEFLADDEDGNILLLLGNIDWFNPTKQHSNVAYGALYYSLCNLPISFRTQEAYVLCAAVMPWISHENKELCEYFGPSISDLQLLKNGYTFYTHEHPNGRVFKAFSVGFASDIPAARKLHGFMSFAARVGCSKCDLVFPGRDYEENPKDHFTDYGQTVLPTAFNLNRVSLDKKLHEQQMPNWPKRDDEVHRRIGATMRRLHLQKNFAAEEKMASKTGYRYTVLHELDYFNSTRFHTIDCMHAHMQGVGKDLIRMWTEPTTLRHKQVLNAKSKEKVYDNYKSCHTPKDITRLPSKFIDHPGMLRAADVMSMHCNFGLSIFNASILGQDVWQYYVHFVMAVRIIVKRTLTEDDLRDYNHHWFSFVQQVAVVHGPHRILPNMHVAAHSVDMLQDYGPSPGHWLYGYERLNWLLGHYFTNNHADAGTQMLRRFALASQIQTSATKLSNKHKQVFDETFPMDVKCFDYTGTLKFNQYERHLKLYNYLPFDKYSYLKHYIFTTSGNVYNLNGDDKLQLVKIYKRIAPTTYEKFDWQGPCRSFKRCRRLSTKWGISQPNNHVYITYMMGRQLCVGILYNFIRISIGETDNKVDHLFMQIDTVEKHEIRGVNITITTAGMRYKQLIPIHHLLSPCIVRPSIGPGYFVVTPMIET